MLILCKKILSSGRPRSQIDDVIELIEQTISDHLNKPNYTPAFDPMLVVAVHCRELFHGRMV